MVYSILSKLMAEGRRESCSISVFRRGTPGDRMTVFGRDISRITRSRIEYSGGETGYERLIVPLESVMEIEAGGRIIFRRKKAIKRIYPRT